MPPSLDEPRAIAQCLDGHPDAFAPLVARYQNAAYATALTLTRDAYEAQDIVQESFIAAYCKLGQLRDRHCFAAWLHRIVTARTRDWQRQRRRRQDHFDSDGLSDSHLADAARREQYRDETRRDLWEQIDRLPEQYRTAVLLHYLSGLSYAEIAAYLDVPHSTVTGRLQQARRRLKQALTPDTLEDIAMAPIDVQESVQQTVCRIATRPLALEVPLDTRGAVLFCGLDTDLEIRPAEDGQFKIAGTLAGVGLTLDSARQSLANVELQHDACPDFLTAGPHAGALFVGTSTDDKGNSWADTVDTATWWQQYLTGHHRSLAGVQPDQIFPHLATKNELPAALQEGLRDVTRISLVRPTVEDLVLPLDALTPEVHKVFKVNNTDADAGQAHGPVGHAHLTVYLPAGTALTVIRAYSVHAEGLEADLNLIETRRAKLEDLSGQIRLFNTHLQIGRRIRGSLNLCNHQYSGVSWNQYQPHRSDEPETQLADIAGDLNLDVGAIALDATDLKGNIRLINRHGTTHLRLDRLPADSRYHLESSSGPIAVSLQENLLEEARLAAYSLCGSIDYQALQGWISRTANNLQLMRIGNDWKGEPNVLVKSESGPIRFEKEE